MFQLACIYQHEGKLAEISSQEENDFITNWILSSSQSAGTFAVGVDVGCNDLRMIQTRNVILNCVAAAAVTAAAAAAAAAAADDDDYYYYY
jgi:hypothetical protein